MHLPVNTLEETLERIKPHAGEFTTLFYKNLFSKHPELQPLFSRTNMEDQKKKLMTALVLIAMNMRKPKLLEKTLKELAERHQKYGAMAQYYPLFGKVLIKTFQEYLGSDWTENTEKSWIEAYIAVTQLMLPESDRQKLAQTKTKSVSTGEPVVMLQLSAEEKIILEQHCERTQRSHHEVLREYIRSLNFRIAHPEIVTE